MIHAYRLHSSRYAPDDGTGAAMYGGRWNRPQTWAIYAASSRPLAVLEILAHYSVLPRDFVMSEIKIPDRIEISDLPRDVLPAGWQKPEHLRYTQQLGGAFLVQTAVLRVPSAVIPEDFNYVINPEHRDFPKIQFGPSMPFEFDPRLK